MITTVRRGQCQCHKAVGSLARGVPELDEEAEGPVGVDRY